MNLSKIYVEVLCHDCKETTSKNLRYLYRRIREGKLTFYCSRKCTDSAHSKRMLGENNPNFNGKWNAPCPSTWSAEKRSRASKITSETMKRKGTSKGENNGRWVGGTQIHKCIICNTPSEFRPYVHRKIEAGEQVPCCSPECTLTYARQKIPYSATSIEIKVVEELKRRGIEYEDQYNFGDKFRPDFLLPEFKIIIECDGDYWHNLPEVIARDKRKDAYYKACGYSVYHFWEHEINTDVEACVDVVLAEINEKSAI